MWRVDPAPTHTSGCASSASLDEHAPDAHEREGSYRPRLEARDRHDLLWAGDPCPARTDSPGHLARVATTVARHERHYRLVVAEQDERLDDLVETAADRLGGALGRGSIRLELLQARLGACRAEERGHPLDRSGPVSFAHHTPGTRRHGTRTA